MPDLDLDAIKARIKRLPGSPSYTICAAWDDLRALVAENERLRAVAEAARSYLGADAAMQRDPSALSARITAFDRWQSARTAAYAALDALDAGGEAS